MQWPPVARWGTLATDYKVEPHAKYKVQKVVSMKWSRIHRAWEMSNIVRNTFRYSKKYCRYLRKYLREQISGLCKKGWVPQCRWLCRRHPATDGYRPNESGRSWPGGSHRRRVPCTVWSALMRCELWCDSTSDCDAIPFEMWIVKRSYVCWCDFPCIVSSPRTQSQCWLWTDLIQSMNCDFMEDMDYDMKPFHVMCLLY